MALYEADPLSDASLTHTRTSDYSYRIPTPPRIQVPPPNVSADVLADFQLGQAVQPTDQVVDVSFLNGIDYANLQGANILGWTYERRREAQSLLPCLYLGPMSAGRDREFLKREGITMMLAVRNRQATSLGAFKAAGELGIHTAAIDAPDNMSLIRSIPTAIQLMNEHLSRVHSLTQAGAVQGPGKVFLFCESGNERSAIVAAAYLMQMFPQIDYVNAIQICQARRFCVNFDDPSKHLLQTYWDLLQARRATASVESTVRYQNTSGNPPQTSRGTSASRSKRQLDAYDDDDDMEMSDTQQDDRARFEGRHYAPFS